MQQSIINGNTGDNLWPLMGTAAIDFASIPPGGTVPITIQVTGASSGTSVYVRVTPYYRRAW